MYSLFVDLGWVIYLGSFILMLIASNKGKTEQTSKRFLLKLTSHVILGRKKMRASPIRIPTVSNDT